MNQEEFQLWFFDDIPSGEDSVVKESSDAETDLEVPPANLDFVHDDSFELNNPLNLYLYPDVQRGRFQKYVYSVYTLFFFLTILIL